MVNTLSLWSPSARNGFLPDGVPASPQNVAALGQPALTMMGETSPTFAKLADRDVTDFIVELDAQPAPDVTDCTPEQVEAIIRCYVCVAAHLIHRPAFKERAALPAAVAKPLWDLSAAVGRPPSLTYASYVLSNFTERVVSRTSADGLAIGQTPSGTPDEEWFVAVHLAVESVGGEVVAAADQIGRGLSTENYDNVLAGLESVESALAFAVEMMPTVRKRLDPETFREVVRPLLYGHDEIAFEGVEGSPRVTYIGETGAQSGVIRAADALLGTDHTPGMVASMDRFLACAPPAHQDYLRQVVAIGARLAQTEAPDHVREARRRALGTLVDFRRVHLDVVTAYLAPEGTSLSERGTGGTHFQVWLQRLIEETQESINAA